MPLRLDDCGDTLTPDELRQVLQISRWQYYDLIKHGIFPIRPLPKLATVRYAKADVIAYLHSNKIPTHLRKVS